MKTEWEMGHQTDPENILMDDLGDGEVGIIVEEDSGQNGIPVYCTGEKDNRIFLDLTDFSEGSFWSRGSKIRVRRLRRGEKITITLTGD